MRWSACAMLLACACDAHRHDEERSPAAAEEKTLQTTVWSERFELFIEHKPPAANVAIDLVTHVTELSGGRPRREGPIEVVLTPPAGTPVRVLVEAPRRPGIYVPSIRLPAAGEWAASVRIPIDGGDHVVALPPLKVAATLEQAAAAAVPEPPEGIAFLKEQQWRLGTGIEPVGARRLVQRMALPAVVAPRPGGRAALAPPVAGRLLAPPGGTPPALGARVEAGALLFQIQPPLSEFAAKVVEAEAEAIRAGLALEQAERSHTRVVKLAADQAKTERELEESGFQLQRARAAHQAALALKAAYEKSGATIRPDSGLPIFELRSPIAGVITRVEAAPGEDVAADRPIVTVLDAETVLIEARIPESELARLGSSRDAVYESPLERGRFVSILDEAGGRVLLLSPDVDPATRTVPLIYEAKNPEGLLRVGMALSVHLETARAGEVAAIPESAIVDEEGRAVAFVQVSGETFQKRDLTLGIRDSGFVQVLEGLVPGERVVTRGAYAIRVASLSTALPAHGHAH